MIIGVKTHQTVFTWFLMYDDLAQSTSNYTKLTFWEDITTIKFNIIVSIILYSGK